MNNSKWYEQFISPSRIDNYIQYKSGYLYDFGDRPIYTTKKFIDTILGLNPINIKAQLGTFIHEIFENAGYGILQNVFKINGWSIFISDNLNVDLEYPDNREIKVTGNIAGLNISGTVDAMNDVQVHDIKTTSTYEAEKYITSYQWKTYLLLTNLEKFVYDVFTVKIDEVKKHLTVLDYNIIPLYAYPDMREEVEIIVTEFKDTLLTLKEPIFERIKEHNKDITDLMDEIGNAKRWACNSLDILDNTIKQLNNKKIILKGINDGN